MATRSNHDYSRLAYRRAVITELVTVLREDYQALSSNQPKKVLLCGEVFKEEAEVPPEEIQGIVEELEQEAERLRLEMNKFTHTRQDGHGLLSGKKAEEGKRDGRQAHGQKGRPVGRSTR